MGANNVEFLRNIKLVLRIHMAYLTQTFAKQVRSREVRKYARQRSMRTKSP